MAIFFPDYSEASFASQGEHDLFRMLAALDDEYTVIHSCPWLRGTTKRIFSKFEKKYIDLFRNNKKNLTGEIDFVIAHPKYGILCIEVKTGEYRPRGSKFVHAGNGHMIDPLSQVKNNAFTIIESLEESDIWCPVGYAVYFGKTSLSIEEFSIGYFPLGGESIEDGIVILPKHEAKIVERIQKLFIFWRSAFSAKESNFGYQIKKFVNAVWPKKVLNSEVALKIAFDNEVWLKLDYSQHSVVQQCMVADSVLVSGFAGTGKTLIAHAVALAHAKVGARVIVLFKNKKISQHISELVAEEKILGEILVSTFHAYCGKHKPELEKNPKDFNDLYQNLLLHQRRDVDVLIVDESQGLSEEDHKALSWHFGRARKFIFADRHQLFASIEKGVEYDFLERNYDSKFFHLTSVYRNPISVTEEILQVLPVEHEIVNRRTDRSIAIERYFVRDVRKSIRNRIESLLSKGAQQKQIVILTQFPSELRYLDIETSTVASFRGMESPIVILVPDTEIDDNTLACALGRCTSLVIVLWDLPQVASRLDFIKSNYLKSKWRENMPELLRDDASKKTFLFWKNIIDKCAGPEVEFDFFNCKFRFSRIWRGWIVDSENVASPAVRFWALFLKNLTNSRIYSVDLKANRLQWFKAVTCEECGTITPHHLSRCIPCAQEEPRIYTVEEIHEIVEGLGVHLPRPVRSMLNVANLIAYSNIVFDVDLESEIDNEELGKLLGRMLILYHARDAKIVITRQQVISWLAESLEKEDFNMKIEEIAARVINSMCARALLTKIGHQRYVLLQGINED